MRLQGDLGNAAADLTVTISLAHPAGPPLRHVLRFTQSKRSPLQSKVQSPTRKSARGVSLRSVAPAVRPSVRSAQPPIQPAAAPAPAAGAKSTPTRMERALLATTLFYEAVIVLCLLARNKVDE